MYLPDIKPTKVTSTQIPILLPEVNSGMINIHSDIVPGYCTNKAQVCKFDPTPPDGLRAIIQGTRPLDPRLEVSDALFKIRECILATHFTANGKLAILSNSRILYIIDTENTTDIISYKLYDFKSPTQYNCCYLSSTDDGAIWAIDGSDCYIFKGHDTAVYYAGTYTVMEETISHWNGNYLIQLADLRQCSTYYALLNSQSNTTIATQWSENVKRLIKWNNKLLVHLVYPEDYGESSISLSLHEWNGKAHFIYTKHTAHYNPVTTVGTTSKTIVVIGYRDLITIYNEELQDISCIRGINNILSACIYLGQPSIIANIPKYNKDGIETHGIIGPLLINGGRANIIPDKLLTFDVSFCKLISSRQFLFLITWDSIFTIRGIWSKKGNKLMPSRIRRSIKTVCTLQTIGALKVPREILDIILTYAFSF